MADIIEYFDNSLIQHGNENNRVYLMKLGNDNANRVIDYIENLSAKNGYTKIFTKIPVSNKKEFINRGYIEEAFIPSFFKGQQDCYFLVKYPSWNNDRNLLKDKADVEAVLSTSLAKKTGGNKISLPEEFTLKEMGLDDAEEIAGLYSEVFKTYPFPIFDPQYILKTMRDNVIYFGIKKENRLVALSSAEIDHENLNAEMTDFATRKDYGGNNFSLLLLQKMEEKMWELGLQTAYTIARSLSYGMNITFARADYDFGGTLVNNTNIYGKIESMNVLYKNIQTNVC